MSTPWRGVAKGEYGSLEANFLKASSPESTLFKARLPGRSQRRSLEGTLFKSAASGRGSLLAH